MTDEINPKPKRRRQPRTPPKKSANLVVRIPEKTYYRFKAVTEFKKLSMSKIVRAAITHWLNMPSSWLAWQAYRRRNEKIKNPTGASIDLPSRDGGAQTSDA